MKAADIKEKLNHALNSKCDGPNDELANCVRQIVMTRADFIRFDSQRISKDDIIQAGCLATWAAINKMRSNKNPTTNNPHGYLTMAAKNAMQRFVSDSVRREPHTPLCDNSDCIITHTMRNNAWKQPVLDCKRSRSLAYSILDKLIANAKAYDDPLVKTCSTDSVADTVVRTLELVKERLLGRNYE